MKESFEPEISIIEKLDPKEYEIQIYVRKASKEERNSKKFAKKYGKKQMKTPKRQPKLDKTASCLPPYTISIPFISLTIENFLLKTTANIP